MIDRKGGPSRRRTPCPQSGRPPRREHPGVVRFGRIGSFAKGLVYVIAGVHAPHRRPGIGMVDVVDPDQEASPTGALKTVAHATGGSAADVDPRRRMSIHAASRIVSALLAGRTGAESGSADRLPGERDRLHHLRRHPDRLARSTNSASGNADGNAKVTTMSGRMMEHTVDGSWSASSGSSSSPRTSTDRQGPAHRRRRRAGPLRACRRNGALTSRLGAIGRSAAASASAWSASSPSARPSPTTPTRRPARRCAPAPRRRVVGVRRRRRRRLGFAAYGVFCIATSPVAAPGALMSTTGGRWTTTPRPRRARHDGGAARPAAEVTARWTRPARPFGEGQRRAGATSPIATSCATGSTWCCQVIRSSCRRAGALRFPAHRALLAAFRRPGHGRPRPFGVALTCSMVSIIALLGPTLLHHLGSDRPLPSVAAQHRAAPVRRGGVAPSPCSARSWGVARFVFARRRPRRSASRCAAHRRDLVVLPRTLRRHTDTPVC